MTQELLRDIGVLTASENGDIHFSSNLRRNVIFGGDALTNRNMKSIIKWLLHQRCNVQSEHHAKTLQDAVLAIRFLAGDFHAGMRMLVMVTHARCYGGFLQALQTQIGWKRVHKDASVNCWSNCQLSQLVYVELVRLSMVHFNEWLQASNQAVACSGDLKLVAKTLACLYDKFLETLKEKADAENDEVVLFMLNYMELMADHELFTKSVRAGDFLVVECLILSWLPIWQAAGKHIYVCLSLDMADLYKTAQGAELEEIRMNRFLRVSDGKNFVALDEMCEMMNFLTKALNLTNDAEQISEMTSWLMLLNHAKNYVNKQDVPHKNSTPPAMTAERKAIFDLLFCCQCAVSHP
jgi:hypothetical protein